MGQGIDYITMQAIAEKLGYPPDVEIVDAYIDEDRRRRGQSYIALVVKSPHLPERTEGEAMTQVCRSYGVGEPFCRLGA